MLQLTKQKKYDLYVQCLNDIEKNNCKFCCSSLQKNLIEETKNISTSDFLSNCKYIFNELYELRTYSFITPYSEWFKNKNERIIALKKCIELTK